MRENQAELSEQEKENIISESMPFIKYTAYRLAYRLPPQLSVQDLISVGVIGLLDSLQRYAEGRRVKLKTFTEYRIRGAMLDELRSQDWVPRSLKDKIARIREARRDLERNLGRVPEEEEVAGSLNISLDEYYRTVQSASSAIVFSFEDFHGQGREEGGMDVTESIADEAIKSPLEQLEENSARETLAQSIDSLPHKEKLILSLYYWEELTLKEIGRVMGLSEGRVCQILNKAVLKLKAQMEEPVLQQ